MLNTFRIPCRALLPCVSFVAGLALLAPASHAQVSGFGSAFTVNGSAAIANSTLTLTDNSGSEAGSAFFNTPQTINAFTSQFVYTPSGALAGDGVAFVLQNAASGVHTLGTGGGGLGYSGITPSAAIELNIYSPNGIGTNYNTNGGVFGYKPTGAVNIASGDPIQVTLNYNGTTLFLNVMDTT